VQIEFKKISSEPEFEAVKRLYLSAFPPEERREYNELIQQLYIEECAVNLIIAGEKTAGFCIVWDFNDFVYLEHFAIEPELRGLGIGEETLSLIRRNFNKPVILETEHPLDEISNRRIEFYRRNGFRLLHRPYQQPSYDGIKPEVEMKLMSTGVDFTSEELDSFIDIIRKKVYHEIS
jgi:ribosomal protein S18 acetylase RimI-like enzyme